MHVVEIAARFDETSIDVRQLGAGTYRIGTARDVDLAVVGLTSFPLVEWTDRGCMLRVPTGFEAKRAGSPIDGAVMLVPGDEIALAIGGVEIRVSMIARAPAIGRPPIDARWWRWAAGALVMHLLFLGIAHALATPEPEGVYVPSIVSLLPRRPEPELPVRPVRVKKKSHQKRVQAARVEPPPGLVEPAPRTAPARRAVADSRRAGILGGIRADQIRAMTGTVDLKKALDNPEPIYREYEAEEKSFGGGRHYVPADSIKTGRYETVATGRAVGEQYALPGEVGRKAPPSIEHPTGGCSATGTMSCDSIRSAIAQRNQSLLDCFDRHARKKAGSVAIEFEVGANGKVVHAHGEGLGNTGACASGVMRRIKFPPTDGTTTAKYSVTFTP